MEFVYIDERGPQENIKKITEPFDKVNKLKYGDDEMHVYVADLVRIPEEILGEIEDVYKGLEEDYLKTRHFPEGKELKGAHIIKNQFKYGVASLKKNEITFYSKLFDLLLKYRIDNLIFTVSKMSLLIDSKLKNWILDAGERTGYSSVLLKYTLTKYAEVEASEKVIKNLLDQSANIESVLLSIEEDLLNIIEHNKENSRMQIQVKTYREVLQLIKETNSCKIEENEGTTSFNWEKVSYNVDLWITENKLKGYMPNNMTVILDEGIPSFPFKRFNFHAVCEGNKSNNVIGLRISDMLVTIAGNYISKMSADTHYDFEKPSERKILSSEWFDITEEQFSLIIKMKKFFLKSNQRYGFMVDTYFDDAITFETFLFYISSYSKFEEYKKISNKEHTNNHFRYTAESMKRRWEEGLKGEIMAKQIYGSLKLAINKGLYHPL